MITLTSSTGFTAGDLIMIELDATSSGGTNLKHYTTQVGAPSGAEITIAAALPSAAAAGRVVQRVTTFNAGTVTYPGGTGTDGVVDGM